MTSNDKGPSDNNGPTTNSDESNSTDSSHVSIDTFQSLIREMYLEKDLARGIPATFMWLMEEVGELSTALRDFENQPTPDKKAELAAEFADVLAWLTTIANVAGVNLAQAVNEKYGAGCPGCSAFVCDCPDNEKP